MVGSVYLPITGSDQGAPPCPQRKGNLGPVSLTELNTDRVCEITLSVVCSACGGCCRYWPVLLWLRAVLCCYCPAPFCRPRGAPTAAAATLVLEGVSND